MSLLISITAWEGSHFQTKLALISDNISFSDLGSLGQYSLDQKALSDSNHTPEEKKSALGNDQANEPDSSVASQALPSTDPIAIALKVFDEELDNQASNSPQIKQITLKYPQSDRAVVTFTPMDLADNKVAQTRYRVEMLTNTPFSARKQWQIVWAGSVER